MSRAALILTLFAAFAGIAGAGAYAGLGRDERLDIGKAEPAEFDAARHGPTSLAAVQNVPDGPPYNGKFTYVRVRYDDASQNMRNMRYGRRGRRGGGMGPHWAHDYPRAETNFMKILDATTLMDVYMEGNSGRVLDLDDPELFKYPAATIIEVGYWTPTDAEIEGLRNYLLKGGFLIIDDTREERGFEFENMEYQLKRALPNYAIQEIPMDHEIWDSFFRIEDPMSMVPPYGPRVPIYLGIFEDNDPHGRIMVMINFNTDLQEYWEFSDRGYYPIDLSNEAYQFGVNYMIYSYTH